jgi:hypothetical protein
MVHERGSAVSEGLVMGSLTGVVVATGGFLWRVRRKKKLTAQSNNPLRELRFPTLDGISADHASDSRSSALKDT